MRNLIDFKRPELYPKGFAKVAMFYFRVETWIWKTKISNFNKIKTRIPTHYMKNKKTLKI